MFGGGFPVELMTLTTAAEAKKEEETIGAILRNHAMLPGGDRFQMRYCKGWHPSHPLHWRWLINRWQKSEMRSVTFPSNV